MANIEARRYGSHAYIAKGKLPVSRDEMEFNDDHNVPLDAATKVFIPKNPKAAAAGGIDAQVTVTELDVRKVFIEGKEAGSGKAILFIQGGTSEGVKEVMEALGATPYTKEGPVPKKESTPESTGWKNHLPGFLKGLVGSKKKPNK